SVFYLTLYPGLSINRILAEKGILSDDSIKQIEKGHIRNMHKDSVLPVKGNIRKMELVSALIPFINIRILKLILERRLYRVIPESFPVYLLRYSSFFFFAFIYKKEFLAKKMILTYFYSIIKGLMFKIRNSYMRLI
ncbi:MAG: hypothetical protein ACOCWO_00150, partial [Candidatus Muiribacteriaceae bacterium]